MSFPFLVEITYTVTCYECKAVKSYVTDVSSGTRAPFPEFKGWTMALIDGVTKVYCPNHDLRIKYEKSEVDERNIDPKIEATITTGDRGETEGC